MTEPGAKPIGVAMPVAGLALGCLSGIAVLALLAVLHVTLLWPAAWALVSTFAALGLACAVSSLPVTWPAAGALLGFVVSTPLAFMVIVIGMNVTPRHILTLMLGTVLGIAMNGALTLMFKRRPQTYSPSATRAIWLLLLACFTVDGAFTAMRFRQQVIPIRERVAAGEYNDDNERAHIARYRFARQFCQGKTVADMASGTGYGTKILAEVAKSVDGYDIAPLGQQFVLDLDKSSWTRHYDVIVSFETIEHLARPDFFLANIQQTSDLLVLSTPLWEAAGVNPFHKQYWTFDSISALLEKRFSCRYLFQDGEQIAEHVKNSLTLMAVCRPLRAAGR